MSDQRSINSSSENSTQTALEDTDIEQQQPRVGSNAMKTCASLSTAEPYSVFSKHKKNVIVVVCCLTGIVSPLSANIYFPALNAIQQVSDKKSYFEIYDKLI